MLMPITGTPIQQDAVTIVALEDGAIATYSRDYYRETIQVPYTEPVMRRYERKLPFKLAGAEHMIAVPVRP